MVGKYDVSHCGDCGTCEQECIPEQIFHAVAEGVTDYTTRTDELGGTWSYGTASGKGYAETSGTAGLFGIDAATNPSKTFQIVCRLTPTGNNVFRLGMGADANNYQFIEVRVTLSGSLYFVKILVGEVVSGGITYYGEHPFSATSFPFTLSSGAQSFRMGINQNEEDGSLTAYYYGGFADTPSTSSGFAVTSRNKTSLGDFAGIFCTTVNGTMRFREWDYSTCGIIQSCVRGASPENLLLEIDGSSSTLNLTGNTNCLCDSVNPIFIPCPFPAYNCNFDCSQIIGTHTLNRGGNYIGDGVCGYGITMDGILDDCEYDHERISVAVGIVQIDAYTRRYNVTVQSLFSDDCTYPGGPGNWGFFGTPVIARFSGTSDIPVEEWVDDIVLERQPLVPGGSDYGCATEGMVAYLRAA